MQFEVGGSEVVGPLGCAVDLIYANQGNFPAILPKVLNKEPFGGDEQDLDLPLGDRLRHQVLHADLLLAIDACSRQERGKFHQLIRHQRDQRSDNDDQALEEQRDELVDQTLAGASRKDHQRGLLALKDPLDGLELALEEGVEAKSLLENGKIALVSGGDFVLGQFLVFHVRNVLFFLLLLLVLASLAIMLLFFISALVLFLHPNVTSFILVELIIINFGFGDFHGDGETEARSKVFLLVLVVLPVVVQAHFSQATVHIDHIPAFGYLDHHFLFEHLPVLQLVPLLAHQLVLELLAPGMLLVVLLHVNLHEVVPVDLPVCPGRRVFLENVRVILILIFYLLLHLLQERFLQ